MLILGAANVSTGQLAKFVSRQEPIRLEHILASAAVPSIFPAVPIGEHVSPRPGPAGEPIPWRVYRDPAGHPFCLVVR